MREKERERERYQTTCKRRQESKSKSNRALEQFSEISYQHGNGWPYLCERINEREANAFWTCEKMKKKNRNNVNETLSIKKNMYVYLLIARNNVNKTLSINNKF